MSRPLFGTLETSVLALKINKADIKYFRLIDKMKRKILSGRFGNLLNQSLWVIAFYFFNKLILEETMRATPAHNIALLKEGIIYDIYATQSSRQKICPSPSLPFLSTGPPLLSLWPHLSSRGGHLCQGQSKIKRPATHDLYDQAENVWVSWANEISL